MKTILFPHTEIFSIRQFPLFLLTPELRIFQPVIREKQPEILDSFIVAGFCQVEPLPFERSEDEQRFLQLAGELHSRSDEYPKQLAELALAARTAPPEDGEQSDRAIRGDLYQESLSTKRDELKKQAKSWHTRLILTIGELIDQRVEEVAIRLAGVQRSSTAMLEQLQGEIGEEKENILDELLRIQRNLPPSQPKQMEKRAESWFALFGGAVQRDDILLTTCPDAVEPLLIKCEKITETPCSFTEELPLPLHLGKESDTAINHCRHFSQQYGALQKELQATSWSNQFRNEWCSAIDIAFPADKYGRQNLKTWSLKGVSLAQCPNLQRIFLV